MVRRVAPLVLVICLVLGPLWIVTSGSEDRSADYEAELARIERAKPEPPPPSEAELRRQLQNAKKVKAPGGATYYVPRNRKPVTRTATAAVDGCVRGPTALVPHSPGITARHIRDGLTLLVTYRIGHTDSECRPTSLRVTADVSDDFAGGDGLDFAIEGETGQVELPLQGHVANADVLVASSWTPQNGGHSSATTTIRIR